MGVQIERTDDVAIVTFGPKEGGEIPSAVREAIEEGDRRILVDLEEQVLLGDGLEALGDAAYAAHQAGASLAVTGATEEMTLRIETTVQGILEEMGIELSLHAEREDALEALAAAEPAEPAGSVETAAPAEDGGGLDLGTEELALGGLSFEEGDAAPAEPPATPRTAEEPAKTPATPPSAEAPADPGGGDGALAPEGSTPGTPAPSSPVPAGPGPGARAPSDPPSGGEATVEADPPAEPRPTEPGEETVELDGDRLLRSIEETLETEEFVGFEGPPSGS